MNKFPKIIDKKWKRYTKIEKFFLIFLVLLFIAELFLPFIKIEGTYYSFINRQFLLTSIILIFTLIFLLIWNSSYTFKGFVKSIFGFEQNDAILNFGVFFLHATLLIYTKEIISILAYSQSSNFYKLGYGFYIIGLLLVAGMIWNLFLAINLSFSTKKKSNYSKIVSTGAYDGKKSKNKEVKSLFE